MLLIWWLCGAGCSPAPLPEQEVAWEVAAALGSARQDVLLEEEERLEDRGNGAEGLALVRLALLDFAPSPERLLAVEGWLGGLAPGEGRLVRAELALRAGDVGRARQLLGPSPPETDLERLLYARLAAAGGEPGAGIAWLEGLTEPAASGRLLRVRLLAAAGRGEEAQAELRELLRQDMDLLMAQVLRVELAPLPVRASLADLVQIRYRLPTVLKARVLGAQAQALLLAGDTGKAVPLAEAAVRLDAEARTAALVLADSEARAGRLRRALGMLGDPAWIDAELQVARLLLLLDLDRIGEAGAFIDDLDRRQALAGLVPAFRYLIAVAGRGEAVSGPEPVWDRPVLAWARALHAIQALRPGAMDATSAALDQARAAANPFERRLTPRIQVARAALAGPEDGKADLRDAIGRWPDDPGLHLAAAQLYESGLRARARAASHYQRAVALCEDCARAWYELGRFYQDSPDDRTRVAWTHYLSLEPSGPRADRVRSFEAPP